MSIILFCVFFPTFKINGNEDAPINTMDKGEDKTQVIVAEEVELLSSVLGLKGESCKLTARTPSMIIEVTQRAQTDLPSSLFKVIFELKNDYPLSAPSVSIYALECAGFTRKESTRIATELTMQAATMIGNFFFTHLSLIWILETTFLNLIFSGSPMLYQLCQIAKESVELLLGTVLSTSDAAVVDESNIAPSVATLVEINHMRDQSRYVKNLSSWAEELHVELKVLHLKFRKLDNHWIIVIGNEKRVKIFKKYLRTRNVDIDSKGRPCKERLVKDVASKNMNEIKEYFASDPIEKDFESIDQLQTWCDNTKLSDLFDHSVLATDKLM